MKNKLNIINTGKAPQAIGCYSQAVSVGNLVFCSGQLGIDPKSGKMIADDVSNQTKQIMKNLHAVLLKSGSSFEQVIKTTIYLNDIKDFEKVNTIYSEYFSTHQPARSTVEVSNLPKNACVEIDMIALVN